MRAAKLAAVLLVLSCLVASAGVAILSTIPARATPSMALLRNGSASGIDSEGGLLWILALGSDYRVGDDPRNQRTDAIHLIGVNAATGAGVILGFPRDSYVDIPGFGTDKINAALSDGGPALTAATVESLTGIHPQYIFMTTFDGLTHMVDRLGGVTVDVDQPLHDDASGADFEPGVQTFNGGQALAFSRDRHDARGGDFGRSKHQGDLLLATMAQIETRAHDRGFLELALNFLLDDTQTDVPAPEVYRLGRLALQIDPAKVRNIVAPGGTGTAGGASIVVLDRGGLQTIVDDIKPDATLDGPDPGIPSF